MQAGDVSVTFAYISALEDNFGFRASIPLRDGLRAFAQWYAEISNPDNWQANYEALKAHVAQTGHFSIKHTRLKKWYRYQRTPSK